MNLGAPPGSVKTPMPSNLRSAHPHKENDKRDQTVHQRQRDMKSDASVSSRGVAAETQLQCSLSIQVSSQIRAPLTSKTGTVGNTASVLVAFCPHGTADTPALELHPPLGTIFGLIPGKKYPGLIAGPWYVIFKPKLIFQNRESSWRFPAEQGHGM